MTLPTHIMAGMVIGKLTGNYSLSIGMAIAPDIDHLFSYAKSGVLFKPVEFFKTVFAREDPYGDQRYILHNILVFVIISVVVFLINSDVGLIFSLAYFSHIILDALDGSDYFPFFPNKKVNIRGPVNYFSKQEFFILLLLILVYFLI